MLKPTLAILTAISLTAAIATSSMAASVKCTVTAVSESKAILDCGQNANKLTVGSTVKVKTAKQKAIEGC